MTKAQAEQQALEELGVKQSPVDFRDAGLDKRFASRVSKRQQLKLQIDALQAEMKELNEEIGSALEAAGKKTVLAGDWRVTVADGVHRSIDKVKLLELGVSAQTILKATKESHYSTVTITEVKQKND